MLDAHQLNIFLAAAELSNFSEAGRRLDLSQPSVSAHIQSLERKFGVELFHRAGRHITLTDAGEALLPLAREMVHLSVSIGEAKASLGGSVVGRLMLGCSTAVGKYALPRIIARFRDQNPQVQVHCSVMTRQSTLHALLEGRAHVAITSAREYSKEIEYRPFITDQVILVGQNNHPWAERGEIDPHELVGENILLREMTAGTRLVLEAGLARHGLHVDQLKPVMVMGNSEALRTGAEEGVGVTFFSRLVAADSIKLGRIVEVKVKGMELEQELFVGRNLRRPATRAQAAFLEFIFDPANRYLLESKD